jgi:hypothetical protein
MEIDFLNIKQDQLTQRERERERERGGDKWERII